MAAWILSCESTVDLPYRDMEQRNIPVLFLFLCGGRNGISGRHGPRPGSAAPVLPIPGGRKGAPPPRSSIHSNTWNSFEPLLQQGDVLHIGFGTGMTPSVKNAEEAAQSLRGEISGAEDHGDRLAVQLLRLRDAGRQCRRPAGCRGADGRGRPVGAGKAPLRASSILFDRSEVLPAQRPDLRPAAAIGAILNICPIMRLDDKAHHRLGKVRGQAAAIRKTLDTMQEHAENGADYAGKCYICHSNCLPAAERLRDALLERFPKRKAEAIKLCDIGDDHRRPHCGPGRFCRLLLRRPASAVHR